MIHGDVTMLCCLHEFCHRAHDAHVQENSRYGLEESFVRFDIPGRSVKKIYVADCQRAWIWNGGGLKSLAYKIEELTGYKVTGGNHSDTDEVRAMGRLHKWRMDGYYSRQDRLHTRLMSWYTSHAWECASLGGNTEPALVYSILASGPSSYRFRRSVLLAARPMLGRWVKCEYCRKRRGVAMGCAPLCNTVIRYRRLLQTAEHDELAVQLFMSEEALSRANSNLAAASASTRSRRRSAISVAEFKELWKRLWRERKECEKQRDQILRKLHAMHDRIIERERQERVLIKQNKELVKGIRKALRSADPISEIRRIYKRRPHKTATIAHGSDVGL